MNGALRWKKIESEVGPELPLFRVRFDTMRHPESQVDFKRMVLETSDWVNVVALTKDAQILMVEQFRFGIGALTIEPVAGMVDPGEDSIDAAKRELLEETGYGRGKWSYLDSVQANPAIHDNLCHFWLAEDVVPISSPKPDAGEAIQVHLMSLSDVKEAIKDGRFRHPLGQSAMSRVFSLWDYPYTPENLSSQ